MDCVIFRRISVCSRERRASPKVTHKVGTIMTKKLGQAFQGLQVQGGALVAFRRRRNLLSAKQDQESTRNLSRGSRYGKVVRCHLPILERGQQHRLKLSGGTTWAGTALTSFRLLSSVTVRWTVTDGTTSDKSATNNKPGAFEPSSLKNAGFLFTVLLQHRYPNIIPGKT